MRSPRLLLPLLVFLAALALRPDAPENTTMEGGDLGGAMATLAEAGEQNRTRAKRAFDGNYDHWSEGVSTATTAGATGADLRPPSPTVAAFVGIASVVGLRDVAALGLYLLFDEAEHRGDWELCALCLDAIPLIDPHFVEAYTIASLFHQKRDFARAEAILRRGLKWNPDDWELLHDAAWLHLRLTRQREPHPEKALPYLRKAVSVRHPLFVRRLYALVLFHLGHREEAEAVLRGLLGEANLPAEDRKTAEACLRDMGKGVDRYGLMVKRRRDVLARTPARDDEEEHHHHHHHHHHGHHHHHH